MELILIRHGQCRTDDGSAYCGWTDAPLTDEGVRQAYALAKKLAQRRLTAVYCSPLKRAKDTAAPIASVQGLVPIEEEGLKELNFGMWESKNWRQIEREYPEEWLQWSRDWKDFVIPGGESARQMYDRTAHKLDEILECYRDDKDAQIAVVTHQGCIRAMACHILGLGLDAYWRFKMGPGGMAVIEINEGRFGILSHWE
jgi:alpha-ribazole phosphatase